MKSAHDIIQHIRHLPEFRLLEIHYCYQKFISLLNPRFQKAIAFVYLRQNTLFVALSHPGFKMELHYNQDLLKNLLTLLSNHDKRCQRVKAEKIVLFNSKYNTILQSAPKEDTVPHYQEMAWGDFRIESEDKELIAAFEKIKKSIEK